MNIKKNLNNSFNKASTIIALSIILGTVAYAWTGPTATAPNNNTAAPINVSATAQTKSGPFSLSGPFTIINGFKGYSGLTIASDDPSTMVTKSYVDAKVETDPTVPAYVKDGIDWSEVTNKPTSFPGSFSHIIYSANGNNCTLECGGSASYRGVSVNAGYPNEVNTGTACLCFWK